MLQKKICMLGSYGVGKTSLIARYVHSVFDEAYHSTIGVKVDRKDVVIGGTPLNLLLWDLHGDDEYQHVRSTYLRGMAGYLLVADGTRPESLDVASNMHELAKSTVGDVPFLLLINKHDLTDDWQIEPSMIEAIEQRGWTVYLTSAKTDSLVQTAFEKLATDIIANSGPTS